MTENYRNSIFYRMAQTIRAWGSKYRMILFIEFWGKIGVGFGEKRRMRCVSVVLGGIGWHYFIYPIILFGGNIIRWIFVGQFRISKYH